MHEEKEIIVIVDDARDFVEETLFAQEMGDLNHVIVAAAFYTLDEILTALKNDEFVGIDGTIYKWSAVTMALVDQNLHSANDKSGELVVEALRTANSNIITIGISQNPGEPEADLYLGKEATLGKPRQLSETLKAAKAAYLLKKAS